MPDERERYQHLLNYLTDYIYTVTIRDGAAAETLHGPGCIAITGYTPEELLRDPDLWFRMVHPNDRNGVLDHARRATLGETLPPIEHRIIHRDGTTRWIRNMIVVSRDALGAVVSYDGLINDITDLKRAQLSAAQRSRQLRQAEKMASLGTLIAGIAHEINNPNNFVMLNAQLFTRMWKDALPVLDEHFRTNGDFLLGGIPFSDCREKIAQSLEGISKGSERIAGITKRLTEYSRLDSDALNELVDVNVVVENAAAIMQSLIKRSTSNFHMDHGSFLPRIRGNAQQLEQVVINLIANACQSLDDPAKEVRLTTAFEPERNRVRISVTDRGVGIREQDMKFILDPFFTTKRNSGGTGLGLSVSYTIVRNHGGKLTFQSKEQEGTTATLFLPIAKELEPHRPT